jgi:type VI secretion system protein ImpF
MDRFVPSLFDKLLGAVGEAPSGTALTVGMAQVKACVARDIETLLNARPAHVPGSLQGLEHASQSLLGYGLPDISTASLASDRDRARIVAAIARALQDHEPRLTGVQVAVREGAQPGAGLCFSIHAQLRLTPGTEPVAFDAVLHPGSQRYAVSSGAAHRAAPY